MIFGNNPCTNPLEDCNNCPRMGENCDGNDEYYEQLEEEERKEKDNEIRKEGTSRPLI